MPTYLAAVFSNGKLDQKTRRREANAFKLGWRERKSHVGTKHPFSNPYAYSDSRARWFDAGWDCAEKDKKNED
jgi:hypothetical protein